MLLLRMAIISLCLVGFVFFLIQVLVPLVTGTIVFPIFRKTRSDLLEKIQEAKAQLDDEDLKVTLANLEAQVKAKQEKSAQIKTGV